MKFRHLPVLLGLMLMVSPAFAQIVFDDANGNASSDGANPTNVVFNLGSNIINGTVTSPANTRNFYTFTVGAGAGFANLGGGLFSPANLNNDLLGIATAQSTGGTGVPSPVGAGDYTFVIQQTGDEVSSFSLDFVVTSAIPEPSSAVLLSGLTLLGLVRRRRS